MIPLIQLSSVLLPLPDRYELLIRTANASSMRELLGELQERKALKIKAVSTIIDVDPVSLT